MATGNLYTVDPQSGEAAQIDLGGVLLKGGDGMVRLRSSALQTWLCDSERVGSTAFLIY